MSWVAPVQTALGLTTKAKAWELVEMLQERDQCPVVYEDFDQAAEEIKALQSELTALKQHLQGSQKKLAAAQTEITSLKKDNSGLQVNLDAVQRSRKREADGYEKELGGLRIELQKCKKEGEEWKRQVDSLSGDEAKTKQVLEEMERELDGAGDIRVRGGRRRAVLRGGGDPVERQEAPRVRKERATWREDYYSGEKEYASRRRLTLSSASRKPTIPPWAR